MGIGTIQPATYEDIIEVATIHKQQFPTHFLGKYSIKLLSAYYKCFLANDSIFLVSKQDSKVNGFVVGDSTIKLSYAKRDFLIQNKSLYIGETLLRPNTYWGVLCRLGSVISSLRQTNEENSEGNVIWLLSIAVDKENMGKGIAQSLCYAFEKSIRPVCEYGVYVLCDNKRAINFYEKMGFSLTKQIGDEFCLTKRI